MINIVSNSHHHSHEQLQPHHQQQQKEEKYITFQSSSLNETPSIEPFNIDPDLQLILKKNQEIIQNSEAQFIIDPRNYKENEINEKIIEKSLIHIIKKRELNKLGRFKESEKLYFLEFNKILNFKKFNSTCNYLMERLNFNNTRIVLDPISNLPITHFTCPSNNNIVNDYTNNHQTFHQEQLNQNLNFNSNDQSSHLKSNFGLVDGLDFRVIRNEWPYAIPKEYQHMIVWSRLPLIDPKLARSGEELEAARTLGLTGIENSSAELKEQLKRFHLNDDDEDEDQEGNIINNDNDNNKENDETYNSTGIIKSHFNSKSCRLDYQIRKFVRLRWPLHHGFFDTFWFLNPAYLQSCPELPHFHVFVKKN